MWPVWYCAAREHLGGRHPSDTRDIIYWTGVLFRPDLFVFSSLDSGQLSKACRYYWEFVRELVRELVERTTALTADKLVDISF